jgi:hypothetical protein
MLLTDKIMDKLKKEVLKWAGLPIEGETKEELNSEIKDRLWQLQCDLDRQAEAFYKKVGKLDIPDE